jgi:hypothetical protein
MLSALILVFIALGGSIYCGADVNEAMAYEIVVISTNECEYRVSCGVSCYLLFAVYERRLIIIVSEHPACYIQ